MTPRGGGEKDDAIVTDAEARQPTVVLRSRHRIVVALVPGDTVTDDIHQGHPGEFWCDTPNNDDHQTAAITDCTELDDLLLHLLVEFGVAHDGFLWAYLGI